MTYDAWERTIPEVIRQDALWKIKAYRCALFLADLSWHDSEKLFKERRLLAVADQLFRACAKVSASIAEGYSRGTGRDRARFYEYALGSVREARDWYYKSRHALSVEVIEHRMELTTELIKLLLTMIARDRKQNRKFEPTP